MTSTSKEYTASMLNEMLEEYCAGGTTEPLHPEEHLPTNKELTFNYMLNVLKESNELRGPAPKYVPNCFDNFVTGISRIVCVLGCMYLLFWGFMYAVALVAMKM